MARRRYISAAEARRLAFAAQGFDRERPSNATDSRHFRRVMQHITVLQLDYVNVLVPAHFFMIFSRLGAYDRQRFEQWLYDSGEYTEQWAHEASVVSHEDWPLLRHRRDDFVLHRNSVLQNMKGRDSYLANALKQVTHHGETTAKDLPAVARPKAKPGDWARPLSRLALEYHFGRGNLAVRRRLDNFQRVYDLPERLIDETHINNKPDRESAQRALVRKSIDALGVATCKDIADYYRLTATEIRPRIDELVETGAMHPVEVEGWNEPAWLAATARCPRVVNGESLLSPFDPMVWFRPRAERLFGFEYRIEIYVPEAKRRWGYYVLPFREGDQLTARVDLKADRKGGALRVQAAYNEGVSDAEQTAGALARELRRLADWLQLDQVLTQKTSAFDKALAGALKRL